jgi:hypothetical protein
MEIREHTNMAEICESCRSHCRVRMKPKTYDLLSEHKDLHSQIYWIYLWIFICRNYKRVSEINLEKLIYFESV